MCRILTLALCVLCINTIAQKPEQHFNISKPKQDSIWRIGGQAVNPLLIRAFLMPDDDRPCILAIDFSTKNSNRFYIDEKNSIDPTTAYIEETKERFHYQYIGKTNNNIHVIHTTITNGSNTITPLLFFRINEKEISEEGQDRYLAQTIVLERLSYVPQPGNRILLNGDTILVIGLPGEKPDINITSKFTTAAVVADTAYPPQYYNPTTYVSTTAGVSREWKVADSIFYFQGKPISPQVVYELNGGDYSLSDGNTTKAVGVDRDFRFRQFVDTTISETGTGFVKTDKWGQSSFSYQYLGKTKNGIQVVRTSVWGGGSGVFGSLLFIRFKIRRNFSYAGDYSDQLIMCLEKFLPDGDRNVSTVTIKGNSVFVDTPVYDTAIDEPTDTTHTVLHF